MSLARRAFKIAARARIIFHASYEKLFRETRETMTSARQCADFVTPDGEDRNFCSKEAAVQSAIVFLRCVIHRVDISLYTFGQNLSHRCALTQTSNGMITLDGIGN
jgi:hypothetical protein